MRLIRKCSICGKPINLDDDSEFEAICFGGDDYAPLPRWVHPSCYDEVFVGEVLLGTGAEFSQSAQC